MSTREIAHALVDELGTEQLNALIAMFGNKSSKQLAAAEQDKDETDIEKIKAERTAFLEMLEKYRHPLPDIGIDPNDDEIKAKRKAFLEETEQYRVHAPYIDEKKELEEYRKEKYEMYI